MKLIYINQIYNELSLLNLLYVKYISSGQEQCLKLSINFLIEKKYFKLPENTLEFIDPKFELIYKDGTKKIIDYIEEHKEEKIIKPDTAKYKIGSIADTDEARLDLFKQIDELILETNSKEDVLISSKKNLVYLPVYFDTGFVDLLDLCLKTSLFNSWTNFDVLIITDEKTKQKITELNILNYFNVYFLITEEPEDCVQASMNKCLVYNFEKINDYGKIFLLDADIMCVKNADIIFEIPICPNQIYPARQGKLTQNDFKKYYHGFPCVPQSFIDEMIKSDQLPFNAGQFLFLNSNKMKLHFENIKKFIDAWTGDYFYEQCFFNYYFCKDKMVMSREMERFVALVCPNNDQKSNLSVNTRLIHFIGPSGNAQKKLQYIEKFLNKDFYASQFKL